MSDDSMACDVRVDTPSLAVISASGKASVRGFEDMLRAMMNTPGWHKDIDTLFDYSALDVSRLAKADIERISEMTSALADQLGGGRCAIVMPDQLGFGLARMWEMLTEHTVSFQLRVFYREHEAREWLASPAE